MRDSTLWLSGNLNLEMEGASFRPFTVFINNSHFYTLTNRWEPEFNRRTVYRMNINSGKDPMLEAFDCPEPSVKTNTVGWASSSQPWTRSSWPGCATTSAARPSGAVGPSVRS